MKHLFQLSIKTFHCLYFAVLRFSTFIPLFLQQLERLKDELHLFTTIAAFLRSSPMKGLVVWRMRNEVKTLSVRAEEELPGIEIGDSENIVLSGTSLASVESLSMPLVQEIVLSADIRCEECQRRVADIMSRMKETESVLVNVLEKEVTITCKYPGVVKVPSKQAAALYRNPFSKIAMIKNIFCSLRG